MSLPTIFLIVAVVSLSTGIALLVWLIQRRSYQIKNAAFQRALWRAMKTQREREKTHRAQRRAAL